MRRSMARAAVALTVVLSPVWATPGRVNADDSTGWSPVYSDSYDGPGGLLPGCVPADGVRDGGAFAPDEVRVADGNLRLGIHRRDSNGRRYTIGGIRCPGRAQQYGRYEFRAAVPSGQGLEAVVGLSDGSPDVTSLRIGNGRLEIVNAGATKTTDGTYSDDFHTFVLAWAPSGLRVSVDGREVFTDPRVPTAKRVFELAIGTGDALAGNPDATTVLPAELRVDFLRIYAYAPEASASSTVDVSGPAGAQPSGGSHMSSGLLVILAVGALLLTIAVAIVTFAIRRRGPRRLRPGHRA
jgi:beta-glucanase (GH16 family)